MGSLKGIHSLKHEGVDAQAWGWKRKKGDDVSEFHKHSNCMLQTRKFSGVTDLLRHFSPVWIWLWFWQFYISTHYANQSHTDPTLVNFEATVGRNFTLDFSLFSYFLIIFWEFWFLILCIVCKHMGLPFPKYPYNVMVKRNILNYIILYSMQVIIYICHRKALILF